MTNVITRMQTVANMLDKSELGASRFQIGSYSGPQFRAFRRQLMKVATRELHPKKYGVSHLQAELYKLAGIEGGWPAQREERFATHCANLLGVADPGEERRKIREARMAELSQD